MFYRIKQLIYSIKIIKGYADCDFERIIQYCKEAIQLFTQPDCYFQWYRFYYLQKKIPALIALGQYEEAKNTAKMAATLVQRGKLNWHIIIIQRLEACFHSGEYQEAYDLYKAQVKYGCRYPHISEYWYIIRGYLYFFIQVGRIQPYQEERFNLGRFLNETPAYSQDKTGVNINILLIQILVQMQRGQFGRIIDRVESLQAYARAHTRSRYTLRANIFIKMILKMESASFHRAATERKTAKLWEKLQATPLSRGQSVAVEIVPYSILWQEMMHLLDNKFRAQKLNISTPPKPNTARSGKMDNDHSAKKR